MITDPTELGCCTIGYDDPPEGSATYVAPPVPHHHHTSGYGSYDRYGHY